MNERIKKLAEQARLIPIEQPDGTSPYMDGLNRFAELIVRECLLSLEPDLYSKEIDYEFEQRFYKRCREKIIKHFGLVYESIHQ